MPRKLTVPYTSGSFTVTLPTVLFLAVFLFIWIGIPTLLNLRWGWSIPDWFPLLTCVLGVVIGFGVSVAVYPLFLRLAEGRQGELLLEEERLRWHIGRRRRQIDFTQPYKVKIAAGAVRADTAHASITLYPDSEIIHLHGVSREEVLRCFPAPYFVDEQAITSAEGLWGFELQAENPAERDFFFALLDCLWRNREQNTLFQLYARYPWERPPQPAFDYIRLIETERMTPEEKAFISELLTQFVDGLSDSYVRLTPDYLVGWVYRSWKSTWSGQPDYYCIMPLGHIRAEVSLPQPDWKPFILSQVLLEGLSSLSGAARAAGPTLQDRRYLYVRGRGKDGQRLELAFDWYDLTDEKWEEGEVFVRYIGECRRRSRGGRGERKAPGPGGAGFVGEAGGLPPLRAKSTRNGTSPHGHSS